MWFRVTVLLAVGSLCATLPRAASSPHAKHDVRSASPWMKSARLGTNDIVPMRIGLKQCNLDQLTNLLMDVSDPDSSRYGKHWSQLDVISYFAPSEKSINAVIDWLVSYNISRDRIVHADNKGWLAFDATVSQAEALIQGQYHEFTHPTLSERAIGVDQYFLPQHLSEHIDFVKPGVIPIRVRKHTLSTDLSRSRVEQRVQDEILHARETSVSTTSAANGSDPASLADCYADVQPACIRALYNISLPTYTKPHPNNSLGIYEAAQTYEQQDLDWFFTNNASSIGFRIPNGTHPIVRGVDGGGIADPWNSSVNATLYNILPTSEKPIYSEVFGHLESSIDFDIAYPIIYPQTITLYQIFDPVESVPYQGGGYEDLLDALDGSFCTYKYKNQTGNQPIYDGVFPDPLYPDNNSLAYNGTLHGYEFAKPAVYTERFCHEITKLALQGVTFLVAAGDLGQGSNANTCIGGANQSFVPHFPATCGSLLAVGGTMLPANSTVKDPEVVAYFPQANSGTGFYSGGGFSNVIAAPSYQQKALATYFADHNPPYLSYNVTGVANPNGTLGRYNRLGRGYPDVSANGGFITVHAAGKAESEVGTSLATPIWASIFTRINEERLAANKSVVGFVNPVLYKHPEVLNDIVKGYGYGCNTTGFAATEGWDPITGLGTPNYPKLLELFMSLP